MSFSKLKIGQELDQIDIDLLTDILGDDYSEIINLPNTLDYKIMTDWREAEDDKTD